MKHPAVVFIVLIAAIISCRTSFDVGSEKPAESLTDFETYKDRRGALVRKDLALSSSASMLLTEAEQRLDRRMRSLQRAMLDHYKETHFFPPARNFYQSKKHIKESDLFQIIRLMPKGGILHLHMSAMGSADWMVDRALATPEMHVYWASSEDNHIKGTMHAYHRGAAPMGFVPVDKLVSTIPNFRDSLRSHIVFDETIDRDSVDIWKEFEHVFRRITGFVTYRPIWTDYLVNGLEILIEDRIQHAELRLPFWNDLYDLDHPPQRSNMPELVQTFDDALQRVRITDPDFTMNIIHANLRFFDEQTIWRDITFTHANRVKYPRWLRGYDLVAEEDAGHPTIYHANNFLRLDSLEQASGVNLPLYLHDGESDWMSVDNLYDAVLLGTKRIGHGFNLFRFPNLVDRVRDQNICMEINPLSNQILGYLRDLRIHPASTYMRRGIDITISSDDPLIFDYEGLSYDFWSIYLAWELDLADLKALAMNSLTHAAMTDKERAGALQVWEKRWDEFVEISNTL